MERARRIKRATDMSSKHSELPKEAQVSSSQRIFVNDAVWMHALLFIGYERTIVLKRPILIK